MSTKNARAPNLSPIQYYDTFSTIEAVPFT